MMDTAIKITSEERYTLEFGGESHTGFRKESEWHGFARFVDDFGGEIIVSLEPPALSWLRRFANDGSDMAEGTIAAISPSLIPTPIPEENE